MKADDALLGFDRDVEANLRRVGGGKRSGNASGKNDPNFLPVIDFADLAAVSHKSWVVDHLLGAGEASCFFGEPGSGKSVAVEDIGLHVAAAHLSPAKTWQGRKLKGGAVLFVALERASVVARRALAFGREHALFGAKLPFGVLRGPLDFRDPATATKIIAAMQALAQRHDAEGRMLVIDTVNRALGNGDENSAKDMGALIATLSAIQAALPDVHILLVHHQPAGGQERMRGHSSLLGSLDVAAHVTNGATRLVELTKASDFDDHQCIAFTLKPVEIGVGDNGEKITAPVVVAEQTPDASTRRRGKAASVPKTMKLAINTLREAVDAVGAVPPESNHIPAATKAVTLDQWRDYARRRGLGGNNAQSQRTAFRRATEYLAGSKLIGVWEPYAWPV
jgi:hypothetical protein